MENASEEAALSGQNMGEAEEECAENPGNTFLQNISDIDPNDPMLNAAVAEGNFTIDDDNLPAPENNPNTVQNGQSGEAVYSIEWGHSGFCNGPLSSRRARLLNHSSDIKLSRL